jgi:tetraacyldisaccharide-1-P 4'-kinase
VPASVKEKVFAFCGLGNPADFINTVSEVFDLRGKMTFRDHYKYTKKDIEMIEQQAGTVGANVLVTTGKDAVKLRKEESRLPCFVAVTGISIDDEQGFCKLL